jgi:hypothetical protein
MVAILRLLQNVEKVRLVGERDTSFSKKYPKSTRDHWLLVEVRARTYSSREPNLKQER